LEVVHDLHVVGRRSGVEQILIEVLRLLHLLYFGWRGTVAERLLVLLEELGLVDVVGLVDFIAVGAYPLLLLVLHVVFERKHITPFYFLFESGDLVEVFISTILGDPAFLSFFEAPLLLLGLHALHLVLLEQRLELVEFWVFSVVLDVEGQRDDIERVPSYGLIVTLHVVEQRTLVTQVEVVL